jgi:gamma-glutamylcyclotransferase
LTSLYFAYGSNMSLAQMRERCPSSVRVGIGRLDGYRLVFPRFSTKRKCGAASVEPSPGDQVWGVIYNMHADDLIALDGHEGCLPEREPHLNNYNRKLVEIARDDSVIVPCITYIATPQHGSYQPSLHYHGLIVTGARENGLPDWYVQRLKEIELLSS